MDFDNNYFILKEASNLMNLPKKILANLYNVRTKADWDKLGYKFKVNAMGMPERDRKLDYYFVQIKEDEETKEAIVSGKKGTRNPLIISQLYELGVDFSEFINLTDDVPLFCNATLLYKNGDIIKAFPLIEKAISYKNIPDYALCRYMELYFRTGMELGKIDLLVKELDYYVNDMDSFVHSRIDSWIDILFKYRRFDEILAMFSIVKDGLNKIIAGKINGKNIYGGQSKDFVKAKLEFLDKLIQKTSAKIEKMKKLDTGDDLKADDINKLIYEFVQTHLSEFTDKSKYYPELETKLFSLFLRNSLSNLDIEKLNKKECAMLHLLLTQYIMFLTTNDKLVFPPWFLENKRKGTLPYNVLLYIYDHKWPYPQMLNIKE